MRFAEGLTFEKVIIQHQTKLLNQIYNLAILFLSEESSYKFCYFLNPKFLSIPGCDCVIINDIHY